MSDVKEMQRKYDEAKRNKEKYLELVQKVKEDEKLAAAYRKEKQDADSRYRRNFLRRLQYERREAGLDGVVLRAQEVANLQRNQIEQEEKLAAELDLIRRQEIRDEKLRQYVRENSHELKELESQLRAAYVNKTLAAQIAEREANQVEEKLRERRAQELMIAAYGNEEERQKQEELKEKEQKEAFRQSLQDQIIEKERQRQEDFVGYMQEKRMLDEIIKKIRDEEAKEQEQKLLMQKKLKEEMEQFKAAREVWKARERMNIEEEERRLREFSPNTPDGDKTKELQRRAREAAAEKLLQQRTEEILERKRVQDEKEEMIDLLIMNEKEAMDLEKERRELEEKILHMRDARATFSKVVEERTKHAEETKKIDQIYVEQLKLKLSEQSKIEHEKEAQKRQLRVLDKQYNEEAMKQNVQKRAENLKLSQLLDQMQEEEEMRRKKIIEEERLKILKEHTPKLLGYFPKGCLTREDLENLGLTTNTPLPEASPFMKKS